MNKLAYFEQHYFGTEVIMITQTGSIPGRIVSINWETVNGCATPTLLLVGNDGKFFSNTGILIPCTEDIKQIIDSYQDQAKLYRLLSSLVSLNKEIESLLKEIKLEYHSSYVPIWSKWFGIFK